MAPLISGDTDLATLDPDLDGWAWREDGKALLKTYKFDGFADAMAFMVAAGFDADAADHHPEWRNVYNRVEVTLTTHDAGGVTDKDISLARAMDARAK